MEDSVKNRHLLCLALLVTACQGLPSAEPASPTLVAEGRALASESCAECHAIALGSSSRNSNAPPFPAIVNQEGLTAETLTFWLQGAHNYPREMDFYLNQQKVDALVAYMLTLRDPNYRRPPD